MQGVRDVAHSIIFEVKLPEMAFSPGNLLVFENAYNYHLSETKSGLTFLSCLTMAAEGRKKYNSYLFANANTSLEQRACSAVHSGTKAKIVLRKFPPGNFVQS